MKTFLAALSVLVFASTATAQDNHQPPPVPHCAAAINTPGHGVVWVFNAQGRVDRSYATPCYPNIPGWAPAVACDLNGDHILDAIYQNEKTGEVITWLMTAFGTIAEARQVAVIDEDWRIIGCADQQIWWYYPNESSVRVVAQAAGTFRVIYIAPDVDRRCTATNLVQSNGHLFADVTCPHPPGTPDFYPSAQYGENVGQWLYAN